MHLFREWGVDPANHTVHHTPCGSSSLGPQSGAHRLCATATLRAASFLAFLAFISCFQVIRRPAAPIEFCRPHAPSGLELDPFHYLEVFSCTAQFAFRLTGIPEHATTLSCLQRLVVVACLLTLAAGAGVGGWAPKTFVFGYLSMPGASCLEGRVAACLPFGAGYRPGLSTRLTPLLVLWLAIP